MLLLHSMNAQKPNRTYRAAIASIRAAMSKNNQLVVSGSDNLPNQGPAILAATHHNSQDVPAIGLAVWRHTKRSVRFASKAEYFDRPVVGRLFRHLGALAIDRDTPNVGQLMSTVEVLRQNNIIGIFPEGGRVNGDEVDELKRGVGIIACLAGARVIPVGVIGHQDIDPFSPRPLHVHFGDPIQNEYSFDGPVDEINSLRDLPRATLTHARELDVILQPALQKALDTATAAYRQTHGSYPRLTKPAP